MRISFILEELKCHSDPCQNGGTCFENSGGYTCTCPPGYKGINCAGQIVYVILDIERLSRDLRETKTKVIDTEPIATSLVKQIQCRVKQALSEKRRKSHVTDD